MIWRVLGGLGLVALACAGCRHTAPEATGGTADSTSLARHPLRIDAPAGAPAEWFEVARGACLSRGVWVEPADGETVHLPRPVHVSLGEEDRPLGSFRGRPFEASDVPFLALFAFDERDLVVPQPQRFEAVVERLEVGEEVHAPLFRQETLDHLARRALARGLRTLPWPNSPRPRDVRVLRVGLFLPEADANVADLQARIQERLRLVNTWLEHRVGLRLAVVGRTSWADDGAGDLEARFAGFRELAIPPDWDLAIGWSLRRPGPADPHVGYAAVLGQHVLVQLQAEPGLAEDLDVVREGTALLHELGHVFGLVHEPHGLMAAVRRELALEPSGASLELWRLLRDRPFPWSFAQASACLDLERIARHYETWTGGDATQSATQAWFWRGCGHRPHGPGHVAPALVGVAPAHDARP